MLSSVHRQLPLHCTCASALGTCLQPAAAVCYSATVPRLTFLIAYFFAWAWPGPLRRDTHLSSLSAFPWDGDSHRWISSAYLDTLRWALSFHLLFGGSRWCTLGSAYGYARWSDCTAASVIRAYAASLGIHCSGIHRLLAHYEVYLLEWRLGIEGSA